MLAGDLSQWPSGQGQS